MNTHMLFWVAFIVIFGLAFTLDMTIVQHKHKAMTVKSALKWTAIWISIAALFGLSLFLFYPQNSASSLPTNHIMGIKFFAGYLTEYMLSIDNLFVFIMIFSVMHVPDMIQPKLLKLGVLLSIVLRIVCIVAGMSLVNEFQWLIYIFGGLLIWMAIKMLREKEDDDVDVHNNLFVKIARKFFKVDDNINADTFFTRINGQLMITSFMLVFLIIGSSNVLFAMDSIPAIIGVIQEGAKNVLMLDEQNYLAITSNVFACMGLVSLFFALKGIMNMFRYLKSGVCIILFFIGAKMLFSTFAPIEHFFSAHAWVSLAVILTTLAVSILLSVGKDYALSHSRISNSDKESK